LDRKVAIYGIDSRTHFALDLGAWAVSVILPGGLELFHGFRGFEKTLIACLLCTSLSEKEVS